MRWKLRIADLPRILEHGSKDALEILKKFLTLHLVEGIELGIHRAEGVFRKKGADKI